MRRRWLKSGIKKQVIVHQTDGGPSLQGVLFSVLPDGVILRAVKYLNPGAGPTEMGGEVHVAREKILFAQIVE